MHGGYGTLTLSGLSIRHGSVSVSGNQITGGGCIAAIGYVVLDHSMVSDCYASGEGVYGGGIFAYSLEMYTSTLSRNVGLGSNTSTGTAAFGGGAYVNTIYLTDSTISGNRAAHDLSDGQSSYDTGGGVFCESWRRDQQFNDRRQLFVRDGWWLVHVWRLHQHCQQHDLGQSGADSHGGGLDLRMFYRERRKQQHDHRQSCCAGRRHLSARSSDAVYVAEHAGQRQLCRRRRRPISMRHFR